MVNVVSTVSFDDLRLRLCVSRGGGCALLVHLDAKESIGAFCRNPKGSLDFLSRTDRQPKLPTEVWSTVATMI